MKREATDEALMLSYAEGEASAFDILYERHRGPLYRFLRRHLGNVPVADELYQDIWMRVIAARERYTPSAKFTTWLYTIAHNRVMDHFRSSGRTPELAPLEAPEGEEDPIEATAPDPASGPEDTLARKRIAARILAALERLPAAQREAFVLQQEADLTVEEIAEVAGVNRETAKSRLRYALAKLRKELLDLR